MYVIEINGQYVTGVSFGTPDLTFDKFNALKFNSEFEATTFLTNQSYFGSANVVSAY
ncbi:hypothetical protein [Periweissella cryptocerci]|uniref:hypothetical protein n=1 Tax=Periweissella cryptocerci TaxID=2506420 RepID=UPI001404CE62|nr:hypothetical protein [Periweissella cryptocerci]